MPPSFTLCNGYQISFAERGSDDGVMSNFQLPTVKDNIDQNPIMKILSGTDPFKRLKAGVYDILYSAEDKSGNKAVNCRIKVVMKGKPIKPISREVKHCGITRRYAIFFCSELFFRI